MIISDYNGDTLIVNDPQLSKTSYKIQDCLDNQNIVYEVVKKTVMIQKVEWNNVNKNAHERI